MFFYETLITDEVKAFKQYWMSLHLLCWWFKGGSVHYLLPWIKSIVPVVWWQIANVVWLPLSWLFSMFFCLF